MRSSQDAWFIFQIVFKRKRKSTPYKTCYLSTPSHAFKWTFAFYPRVNLPLQKSGFETTESLGTVNNWEEFWKRSMSLLILRLPFSHSCLFCFSFLFVIRILRLSVPPGWLKIHPKTLKLRPQTIQTQINTLAKFRFFYASISCVIPCYIKLL